MRRQLRLLALMSIGACALAAGTSAADAQRPAAMTKQEIRLADFPNALCNDGSLPVFYFQPGSADDRNKWVVFLLDTGGCTSDAACAARAQANSAFVSTRGAADTFVSNGIMSAQRSVNPDFADYNHVLVTPCSSDGYAGDGTRVINGVTWQFRGKQIVEALIEQLRTVPIGGAPTLAQATDVLLAGSSGGAMGVLDNIDRVAARLPSASVKGIADSAWVPAGTIPFKFGTFAARPDQPPAMAYFNAQPNDACMAANPKTPAACLGEAFAFPYVRTPVFIYADQRDPNILAMLGVSPSPMSLEEADYVSAFALSIRQTLRDKAPAYFAANLGQHNILLLPLFARYDADGITLGDTLHNWYFGLPGNLKIAAAGPGESQFSLSP